MPHYPRIVGSLMLFLVLSADSSADEPAKLDTAQLCFDRFQKITTLVMDHHIDPPTLQEMFLGGVKALYLHAGVKPPADLSRRVSGLSTGEQYLAFLKESWPKFEGQPNTASTRLQTQFIQGLLQRLPGHVDLIPAAEARVLDQSAANRYVGTGIQLKFDAKEARPQIVIALLRGPLRKAGGRSGDLIMEIDGVNTKDMKLVDAVQRLRGLEGTAVMMKVQQPGEKEARVLKVTRGPVPFETVVGFRRSAEDRWQYRVDTGEPIAYVRLAGVLPSTPGELRKIEKNLLEDGAKGLVLDLRGNLGDDVQSAALTADELLDGGLMWRLHDNKGRIKDFRADRDCILRDIPLVVLVNEFSRGSAEFIAAALKDNHRAVVVGTASEGDGVVTTLFLLPDDLGGMKLPTGRLERAVAGKDAQRAVWKPVSPDHVVPLGREKSMSLLVWHNQQMSPDAPAKGSPPEDVQLVKALEILRSGIRR